MRKRVSIVIPAYNEGHRIKETLEKYFDYFNNMKEKGGLDFEIVVVLNACKDNTREIVEGFLSEGDRLRILEFERGGKGFAIIEGFKDSLKRDNEFIGFLDADGSTPPNAFYGLINHIRKSDGIIANRYDDRSNISPKQTIFRQFISRVFNTIVRSLFLFNHRDTQCGAKLFRRKLIEKLIPKLTSTEMSFDIDLLFYSRRFKARIKSIPTEWGDKEGSVVNLKKTPGRMFFSVFRLRIFHSPFRFLLRFHSKLPRKMQVSYWFGV